MEKERIEETPVHLPRELVEEVKATLKNKWKHKNWTYTRGWTVKRFIAEATKTHLGRVRNGLVKLS